MLIWPQLFLSQGVVAAHVDVDLMKVIALQFKKIAIIFVNRRWNNFWILYFKPRADLIWTRGEVIKIAVQNLVVSSKQASKHLWDFGIAAFESALIGCDGECCEPWRRRRGQFSSMLYFFMSSLAKFVCMGVNSNSPSGSRLIMKLTDLLQNLQTPSNMIMYRLSFINNISLMFIPKFLL